MMDSMSRRSNNNRRDGGSRTKSLSRPHYATDIESGIGRGEGGNGGDDVESQHSRSQIIKETRTFAVETFPDDVGSTSTYHPSKNNKY